MASLKELINTLKNKAETIFYDPSDVNDGYGYAQQDMQNDPYQQPYQAQDVYQQQPQQEFRQESWQQPQQNYQQTAYQQPQQEFRQAAYQQPQQNFQQAPFQQPQQNFQQTAYQQPQQEYQQAAYQQPQQEFRQAAFQQQAPVQEDPKVVPFPNAQQPQPENAPTACVINARNVSECYSAIVQLRSGNMVVVVLENITDNMEMRHYVDMLSGACYALKATITKLSRHGAYLIAPNHVRVCVDAATNQFNSPASRMQRPQMPFQQQMPQQGQQPLQQNPYMQRPDGAYQRPARMNDAEQMPMYSRPVSPDPRMAPQQNRMAFNGHVPDMPMENAQ